MTQLGYRPTLTTSRMMKNNDLCWHV